MIEFARFAVSLILEERTLTERQDHSLEWLRTELDKILASYQSPHERRVGHGNLRHEYSTWTKESERLTNIAIIYETPGGSTTQLNITYNHEDRTFSYLDVGLGGNIATSDGRECLQAIHTHVRGIPAKRQAQLDAQVDTWMDEGKSKREVFAELNKLLQEQFLGGRITTNELKAGIQHAIRLRTQPDG